MCPGERKDLPECCVRKIEQIYPDELKERVLDEENKLSSKGWHNAKKIKVFNSFFFVFYFICILSLCLLLCRRRK